MAARWNSGASQYVDKLGPVVGTSTVIKSFATYAGVAMAAAALSRYGTQVIAWLHVPYAASIGEVLAVVTLVSLVAAVWTLTRWQRSRRLKQAPSPPVSSQGRGYMDATPHSLLASAASTRSSLTSSPGTRLTPYSGAKAVATPQELRHYIDAFGRQPLSPLSPSDQNAGYGTSYEAGIPAYPSYHDQGQDGAPSPVLPVGRDAPTYRPSLLPRKVVASAGMAATDALQPGTDQDMRNMLAEVLGMGQQDMDTEDGGEQERQRCARSGWGRLRGAVLSGSAARQGPRREPLADLAVWTERLREWLGVRVLRPLVALVDGAHAEVAALLRAAGEAQQQLPPLWAAVEGGGGAGGGGVDAEQLVRHLLQRCAALPGPQQEQLRPLMVALHRYDCLLSLLKGQQPRDLLPPTAPGYIAARVRTLAVGSCMQAFNWNGGGEHMGRAWAPGLPTDSALVMYLFAAFLDAPGWEFPLQPAADSRGTPLYLGHVPSRTPAQYSAILAYRPERPGPAVAALIGSNLSSLEPRFSFLACSRAVTLSGRDAVFHAVLMFVQFHAARRHGLLGGHSISDTALGLDAVIVPAGVAATVPQRVFNWWFPPQR